MTATKLVGIIVVSVILAFAAIQGIKGFTGQDQQQNDNTYQVVPCVDHPEAIGC